jgi:hypothetical protein
MIATVDKGDAELPTWGLTFDMSGGRKQAQPAGGRPLDGGVRHVDADEQPWRRANGQG